MGKIFNTIDDLINSVYWNHIKNQLIVTSGGFDPIHVGHIRCLQESVNLKWNKYSGNSSFSLGHLVIIVNGDGFLTRKKGKPFMNHSERMEIVAAIEGVDYVVGWDDGSQTVVGALQKLKPKYFTKGGDRSTSDVVPEFNICNEIGCEIIFGVGGTNKAQSSSVLIKNGL